MSFMIRFFLLFLLSAYAKANVRCESVLLAPQMQVLVFPKTLASDLKNTRPLIAIFRTLPKDEPSSLAMLSLLHSMPPTEQDEVFRATGFRINKGPGGLPFLQETPLTEKPTSAILTRARLLLVQQLNRIPTADPMSLGSTDAATGAPIPPSNKIIFRIERVENSMSRDKLIGALIVDIMTKAGGIDFKTTGFSTITYLSKVTDLMAKPSGMAYTLFNFKRTFDVRGTRLLHAEGTLNFDAVSQGLKQFSVDLPADQIASAMEEFEGKINKIRSLMKAESIRLANAETPQNTTSNIKKKPVETLPSLVRQMEFDNQHLVETKLRALILSAAPEWQQRVEAIPENKKPELILLKMAYELERDRKISKGQILDAVTEAIDEATTPLQPSADRSAQPSEPSVHLDNELNSNSDPVSSSIPLSVAETAEQKLSIMKRQLRVAEKLAEENDFTDSKGRLRKFSLVLFSQKEFFEVLRPGSIGFEYLEKNFEVVRARLQRVVAFEHGVQNVLLPSDGHNSLRNKGIFSIYHGNYRFLVALKPGLPQESSFSGGAPKARLIVLVAYSKANAKNGHANEDRYYDLATQRLRDLL